MRKTSNLSTKESRYVNLQKNKIVESGRFILTETGIFQKFSWKKNHGQKRNIDFEIRQIVYVPLKISVMVTKKMDSACKTGP